MAILKHDPAAVLSELSDDGLGIDTKIYGRRFGSDGTSLDPSPFRIDASTDLVRTPRVETDGTDEFVVVWQEKKPSQSQYEILARRFDAAGQPVGTAGNPSGAPFVVSTATYAYESYPDVAVDPAGNFVTVWQRDYMETSEYEIFARRFDSTDEGIDGAQWQVNSVTDGFQRRPAVSVSDDGRFIVALDRGPGKDKGDRGYEARGRSSATIVATSTLEVVGRIELGFGLDPALPDPKGRLVPRGPG